MSSAKRWPFCLGPNVLKLLWHLVATKLLVNGANNKGLFTNHPAYCQNYFQETFSF